MGFREKARVMQRVELLISRLLLGGVVTSIAVVLVGVVLMFIHHPQYLQSTADLKRLTTPGRVSAYRGRRGSRRAGRPRAGDRGLGPLAPGRHADLGVAVSIVGFALSATVPIR